MTTTLPTIGSTTWVVADGYIPAHSTGPAPEMTSHESMCLRDGANDGRAKPAAEAVAVPSWTSICVGISPS